MSGPGVALVPFEASHVARTYRWVSDPALRRDFVMRGEPTPAGHEAYFAKVLADPTQRVFAVLADGVHVGNAGLKDVEGPGGTGELWIYIGDPGARGRGAGSAGTRALLAMAFGELALSGVRLHVADFNTAARSMYERLGFRYVPLGDQQAELWQGRGFDVLAMEMGRSEWTSR